MVITPDGRVARYFYGIDYSRQGPRRTSSSGRRAGRIGSPIGRLLLLCYDYDAATGKYTLSIVRLIRVLGTATAVSLGTFLLVMFRRERRGHARGPGAHPRVKRSRLRSKPLPSTPEARDPTMWNFPLFPEQASTNASRVDAAGLLRARGSSSSSRR